MTAAPAPHTGWDVLKIIVFETPTTIVDQEVLIILNSTNVDISAIQADADDLRFYLNDGNTLLDFFIEQWNPTGDSYIWVQIPNIGTQYIHLEYDNDSATKPTESQVWTGYFLTYGLDYVASPWTKKTTYDGKFPRGNTTAGNNGGFATPTHTHTKNTLALSSVDALATRAPAGTTEAYTTDDDHTHTLITGSLSSGVNLPLYVEYILYQYTQGIIPQYLQFNLILLLKAMATGAWGQITVEAGRYLRPNTAWGATGGTATHGHGILNTDVHTPTSYVVGGTINVERGTYAHIHEITFEQANAPAYVDFIVALSSSTVQFHKDVQGVAMFTELPPMGWEFPTELMNKLPRCALTYGGTGGANLGHTHAGVCAESSPIYVNIGTKDDTYRERCNNAAHVVTGETSESTYEPAYSTMIYGQRKASIDVTTIMDWLPPVIASFTAEPKKSHTPAIIQFRNASANEPTDLLWEFEAEGFTAKFGSAGVGDNNFSSPSGICCNGEHLFIADAYNDRIVKYTMDGTFVAEVTSANGTDFDTPMDVCCDDYGAEDIGLIYIADTMNNRVVVLRTKDLSYSHEMITFDSGKTFSGPRGIACSGETSDSSARRAIFIADTGNDRIVVINSSNEWQTTFGSAGTGDGEFDNPQQLTFDGTYLYVVDTDNHRVQRLLMTSWTLSYSSKFSSSFSYPKGISTNGYQIAVSDTEHHQVQLLNRETFALEETLGTGSASSDDNAFSSPSGSEFINNQLFIVDAGNSRIKRYVTAGRDIMCAWGARKAVASGWYPRGMSCDSEFFYMTNANGQCLKYTHDYTFVKAIGGYGDEEYQMFEIIGNDNDDTYVYCCDYRNGPHTIYHNRIQVYNKHTGVWSHNFGETGSGNGQFNGPFDIVVLGDYVYVTDNGNNRVQVFTKAGAYVSQFACAGSPYAMCTDGTYLYITFVGYAAGSDEVRKYTTAGTLVDTASGFSNPYGIDYSEGRLYVGNTSTHSIFVLDSETLDVIYTAGKALGYKLESTSTIQGLALWGKKLWFSRGSMQVACFAVDCGLDEENPTHLYRIPGIYDVSLEVNDAYTSSKITRTEFIEVSSELPSLRITVTPESGPATLNIECSVTDISYGPLEYDWDWGDETTHGSGVAPSHSYTVAGTYKITCTASNAFGSTDVVAYVIVTEGKRTQVRVIMGGVDISRTIGNLTINHARGTTSATGNFTSSIWALDKLLTITEGMEVEAFRYFYDGTTQVTQHIFSGSVKSYTKGGGKYAVDIQDKLVQLTKLNINTTFGSSLTPMKVTDILEYVLAEAGLVGEIDDSDAELSGYICRHRQGFEICQSLCEAMGWQMHYDPRYNWVKIGAFTPTDTTLEFNTDTNITRTPKWSRDLTQLYNKVTLIGKAIWAGVTEEFINPVDGGCAFTLSGDPYIIVSVTTTIAGIPLILTPSDEYDESTGDYYMTSMEDPETLETVGVLVIHHNQYNADPAYEPLEGEEYEINYIIADSEEAESEDTTSQATYGVKSTSVRRLDISDEADLQVAADAYILVHKDPIDQVDLEIKQGDNAIFWVGDKCDVVDTVTPKSLEDLVITKWVIQYPQRIDRVRLGRIIPLTADYLKGLESRLKALETGSELL